MFDVNFVKGKLDSPRTSAVITTKSAFIINEIFNTQFKWPRFQRSYYPSHSKGYSGDRYDWCQIASMDFCFCAKSQGHVTKLDWYACMTDNAVEWTVQYSTVQYKTSLSKFGTPVKRQTLSRNVELLKQHICIVQYVWIKQHMWIANICGSKEADNLPSRVCDFPVAPTVDDNTW